MNTITKVVFVRHAQTEMINKNRIHGQSDGPLSAIGVQEARKTAERFRGQSFDAFYSSPIGRALRTAEYIGDTINISPTPLDGLKERYYGWLEGKSLALFEPDLSGPKITLPLVKFALRISGEKADDFVARVTHTFDQLIKKHQGQRILIVLHWGNLSILKQYLTEQDISKWRGIGPWTSCGITEYHLKQGRWHPVYVNESSHLL